MITLRVAYTYRGERRTTARTLNDRSEVGAELDMLDRCGYDDIDIVEIVNEDGTRDGYDGDNIPF